MPRNVIWKFPLEVAGRQTVLMPSGAQILKVDVQRDGLFLWAIVDEAAQKTERKFHVYGTGHPIDFVHSLNYIGTAQVADGALVWHVFEDLGQ